MQNSNKTSILIQFTIYLNSNYIGNILNQFSNMNINICGFTIMEEKTKRFVIKLIVGKNNIQSPDELALVRNIITNNKLQYYETKVIKASLYNNTLSTSLTYLLKDLDLNASYFCNDGSIIYETCCPIKAMKILDNL